jgi:hypothetical protein
MVRPFKNLFMNMIFGLPFWKMVHEFSKLIHYFSKLFHYFRKIVSDFQNFVSDFKICSLFLKWCSCFFGKKFMNIRKVFSHFKFEFWKCSDFKSVQIMHFNKFRYIKKFQNLVNGTVATRSSIEIVKPTNMGRAICCKVYVGLPCFAAKGGI